MNPDARSRGSPGLRTVAAPSPILVAGSGEQKTLRLVSRYADGSNIFGGLDQVRHLLEVLEGPCEAVRRDPETIALAGETLTRGFAA